MKLLILIKKKVRTLKRRRILKKCIENVGGDQARKDRRGERLEQIRKTKQTEIASLVNSWKLKEIKPPTDEEYYQFFFKTNLTLSYIVSIKRKYWEDH